MQRIEADQLIPGHGAPGIMAALEAGVLTIEHGSYIDDEACTAMKEAGAAIAMGSDLGGTGDGTAAWGRSRHASQRMSDASRFPRRLWAI